MVAICRRGNNNYYDSQSYLIMLHDSHQVSTAALSCVLTWLLLVGVRWCMSATDPDLLNRMVLDLAYAGTD